MGDPDLPRNPPRAVKPHRPARRAGLRAALALAALGAGLGRAGPVRADLDRVRAAGTLKVALYKDFAPFSDGEAGALRGLDVRLAQSLAARLGLKLALLPFDAGENVADDLRNMVWKGHYLGYGPADVMLHVPVDRRLIQANEQALIFAPYYRETFVLAHDRAALPEVRGVDDLKDRPLAAEQGSAGASALLSAGGGLLRERVRIAATPADAMARLLRGEVAAALVTRAQAEAALAAGARREAFGLATLAMPAMPPNGWAVGMAVRADARELARALDDALGQLRADGTLQRIYAESGVTLTAP